MSAAGTSPAGLRGRPARLSGAVLIEPTVFADERGFFAETFREDQLERLGIGAGIRFVQDNHSRSCRGVVRGMHFQLGAGVAKLVRCARGSIVDVIVDVRRDSPQYGQWEAFELDDRDHRQLYVPVGFAHGFCVCSEQADVIYRQTGYYDPVLERSFAYNDPDVAIEWPVAPADVVVSARDASAPLLRELAHELDAL